MKYFKQCVTLEDLKSAYKALSKIYHPDVGGDVKVMSAINVEYEKLEAKFSKKATPKANSLMRTAKAVSLQKSQNNQLAKKEDNPLMKLKKQMLGTVVRKAHQLKSKCDNISEAFKKAWAWFKKQKAKGKVGQKQLSVF